MPVFFALVFALAAPGSPSPSSGSQGGARAERGGVDPLAVLESGGAWLVDAITPDDRQPERPRWDSAESPRHAVLTFMQGMEAEREGRGGWRRAALALPPGDEAALRRSADALYDVLLRLAPIEPIDVPHADALREGQTRYELFPRGLDHQWIWQSLDAPPDGRVVLAEHDGRWRFTASTLAGADRLARSLAPIAPWFEHTPPGALFVDVFRPTFARTPWWGWLAAGGVLALAGVIGWFGRRRLMRVDLDAPAVEAAVHALGTPVLLLLVTLATVFASLFLHFGPVLSGFRWSLVRMLGLLTLVWALFALADLGTLAYRRWFGRDNPYRSMALTVVRRLLRIVVFVMVLLFVLENVFDLRIGALIGSLGLIGLALSLAGKDAAKNLFGALVVFFTRPFMVDDWIEFEGYLGVVEDVGVQATKLRLLSGELVTVPNMKFVDRPVENLSRRREIRRQIDLAVPYDTPREKVDAVIEAVDEALRSDEVVGECDLDLEGRPPEIAFTAFEADHLQIRVYYWYQMGAEGETQRDVERGWYSFLHHCTRVNRALMAAFEQAGVSFAFPTQALRLSDDADRGLSLRMLRGEGGGDGEGPGEGEGADGRDRRAARH